MKLVILETLKWSSFGLLKATKLVMIRSSCCNVSMNTKPGHTHCQPQHSIFHTPSPLVSGGRVCEGGPFRLLPGHLLQAAATGPHRQAAHHQRPRRLPGRLHRVRVRLRRAAVRGGVLLWQQPAGGGQGAGGDQVAAGAEGQEQNIEEQECRVRSRI